MSQLDIDTEDCIYSVAGRGPAPYAADILDAMD